MEHINKAIEQSTCEPYAGCPWRVFHDPLVADVVESYSWFDKKQLHTLVGPNPPAKFLQAIGLYHRVITKLQNDEAEKQAKRDKDNARKKVIRG